MTAVHLAFNGAIVFMIGLLAGFPFMWVILKEKSHDEMRAWRVAHSSLCMSGIAMIAAAAALPMLHMQAWLLSSLIIAFIASGYGFCFSMLFGASMGQRGLSFSGSGVNRLVYAGNFVGSAGSLIAAACFIYGTYLAL